ncbi:nuclear transport factor 2 family protein [Chryseobacterium sp. Tr-659]|uniref:YybH family protein n=1 Tax=Chryseobacterium sp. Tr-659 TaxID=2608340 RepID=UPI001E4EFE83|nr:nuclear transport factor 2 family protein [Chryseobacterium sp. Tr-659]NIF07436.1 nuclear transport factor 2 family protein [Chryseobacterium sp. Tr-659]
MKLTSFLISAYFLLLLSSCKKQENRPRNKENNGIAVSANINEKQQVLNMVRKYTQSVNEGDLHPEIIDELWEHSPDVSNINIRGHQKGFEEIKTKFYAPIFEVLKDRNLQMVTDEREPAVYIFDNTAVVEFYWKLNAKLKDGDKPVNMLGRETHVFRKKNGNWKLIHLHYSGMPIKGF